MKVKHLLEPLVAKAKFAKAVEELEGVKDVYGGIWRLRNVAYPALFIDVLSAESKKPAVTLYMNLRNFDFLPPSATLLSLDLRTKLTPENVPGTVQESEDKINHVVWSKETGLWFCSPGFHEYHEFYYPLDPWELVRGTERGSITWIVNQACNLIDRHKI
jgi:hypothetical protein